MKKLVIVCAVAMLCGCDFKSKKAESQTDSAVQSPKGNESAHETSSERELQTKSGKRLTVAESHPDGMSLSDISILPHGFDAQTPIEIKGVDPVSKIELGDLDHDGFEELYIYTQSAGSGSAGTVYAFASDKDKELKPIDCSLIGDTSAEEFKGYQGHDFFKLEGNSLARTFPIYKESDVNASPSGGKKTIRYKLVGLKLAAEK